jgi:hypothetical protein
MRKNSIKPRNFYADVTNICIYKIAKELCVWYSDDTLLISHIRWPILSVK